MNNNKYVIFYQENDGDTWQAKRLDLPFKQWENYCKKQNYEKYSIVNLSKYTALDMHLITNITFFNNKYYLVDEKIPYPKEPSQNIEKFDVSIIWEDSQANTDIDYDDVHNGEPLCTCVTAKFNINNYKHLVYIEAQCFVYYFPEFLEKLKNNNHAVYTNEEYSPIKWIAWINDDNVRIIQKHYGFDKTANEFDVLVDKDYFFRFGYSLIATMQDYINADTKKYKKYIDKKSIELGL